MNKKYIEGFSEDIVIDINNLKEKCIFLIRNIEQNAKKYKEYIKNETKEFQKIKERSNNNVIFTPENLLNNSPITILDAPWGAGKTYFIESLCKYIMNKEISLDYIEKIIVVDSWRYSISRSIPNDFIFYLVDNLASTLNLKNKAKDKFFTFLNQVPLSIVNNAIGTSLKIKENQLKELHSDKIIDSLNKYINKTILVIVDNIERIGENGWEILKTIQRLAMLNNLIFLLPMNKAKLVSEKLQHSEWKIEKYINIPFYKFKQDYVGLLKKYGLSDDLLEDINNLLSTKIDEECLSIRELDKILSKRDIGDNFTNKYKSLIFFNEIWPLQNKIKNIILKDIESFLTIIEDIKNDINSFNNLFFTNYSFHNYQPIYYNYQPNNYNVFRNIMTTIKEYFKLNIIEPTTLDLTKFIKKIAENKKDLKFYIKSIEQIEKDVDFNKYIKEKSDLVKKENKIIIDNNKLIEKIEKKIEIMVDYNSKYESNQMKKSDYTEKKYTNNKAKINDYNKKLIDYKNKNSITKEKVVQDESDITNVKKLNDDFINLRNEASNKINDIYQKYKSSIFKNKNMSFIFDVLFNNVDNLNENINSNNIEYIYENFIKNIKI